MDRKATVTVLSLYEPAKFGGGLLNCNAEPLRHIHVGYVIFSVVLQ